LRRLPYSILDKAPNFATRKVVADEASRPPFPASRVLALSLLASLYPAWLAGLCAVHWAVMSAWLALGQQHTAVCASRCEELLFSVVLGLAYVLAFVSPRDGPTRYAYLAYYLVFFIENTGALVVW
jgi:hypothetical protein